MMNMFSNIVVIIQYLLILFYICSGSISLMVISSVIGLVSLIITFLKQNRKGKEAIFVSLIISFVLLIIGDSWYATPYSIMVALFSHFSLACILLSSRINSTIAFVIAFSFPLIVLYRVFAYSSSEIFATASINFIPIYVTIFLLPYFINCHTEKKYPSIIPILLCLVSCFLTHGRGNIIFSVLILLCIILCKYYYKITESSKRSKIKVLFSCLISVVVIISLILVCFPNLTEDYLYRFVENKSESLEEEARVIFLLNYIDEIFNSFSKFLFGADYRAFLPVGIEHLHNSFLMTHHFVGFLGFVLLVRYVVKGCLSIWSEKNLFLLAVFVPFSIKCFTEWAFPLVLGDVFIWYVILYPYLKKSVK